MLSPHTYYLILFLVSAFAFWRGRVDEWVAAATCIVATFATNIVYNPNGSFAHVEYGVFIVDAATFVAFTLLALRSERFWPLWIAGLQLTTLMSHLLKLGHFDLLPQAYAAAARFWVYPIFLIIVIGTWRGGRRRRALQSQNALAA